MGVGINSMQRIGGAIAASIGAVAYAVKKADGLKNKKAKEKARQKSDTAIKIKKENKTLTEERQKELLGMSGGGVDVDTSEFSPAINKKWLMPQEDKKEITNEQAAEATKAEAPVQQAEQKAIEQAPVISDATNIKMTPEVQKLQEVKNTLAEKQGLVNEPKVDEEGNIDMTDQLALLEKRRKNSERGQKAWESRLNKAIKFSGMNGEQYIKSGMSFKDLEEKQRKHFEEFTPIPEEAAKTLGVSKDNLRLYAAKAENGEGDGIENIFNDLKKHFKDDKYALEYIKDKFDNVFARFVAGYDVGESDYDETEAWNTLVSDLLTGKYKEYYDPEVQVQKEFEYYENADKRAEEDEVKNRLNAQYAEMKKRQEENKNIEKAKELEEAQAKLKALPEMPDYDKLEEEVRTKDTFRGYKIGKSVPVSGGGGSYDDRSKLNFGFSTISKAEQEAIQNEYSLFEERGRLEHKIDSLTRVENNELSSEELESWQKLIRERAPKNINYEDTEAVDEEIVDDEIDDEPKEEPNYKVWDDGDFVF